MGLLQLSYVILKDRGQLGDSALLWHVLLDAKDKISNSFHGFQLLTFVPG